MKMIQAMIRPEKAQEVMDGLAKSGIHALTSLDVTGRGRQKGLRVGTVRYEELPKIWLMVVVHDEEADRAMDAIKIASRTGNPGDGKLFLTSLTEARTIQTGLVERSASMPSSPPAGKQPA